MATLKNLVHKGVKVELGLPYELWDEPSVEVSDMKKQVHTRVCLHINTQLYRQRVLRVHDNKWVLGCFSVRRC